MGFHMLKKKVDISPKHAYLMLILNFESDDDESTKQFRRSMN